MTLSLWRIATDAPSYKADDLSGAGAKISGGRWNEAGLAVLYSSPSISLACLETIVHLNAGGLPFNRYLIELEVPDDVAAAARIETVSSLQVGWEAEPAAHVSIQLGSDWLRSSASALLMAPSVIVPEESNVLINPGHPDASRITAKNVRRWLYDPRLRAA